MTADIEDIKEFWDINPRGFEVGKDRLLRECFERIERERYLAEWHIPLVAAFEDYAGKDVLEVGCGIGTDAVNFVKAGARYVGLDISPRAVEIARARFDLYGLKGEFRTANSEKLPFPDGSFDHVYSFGVIHHLPDPGAAVREIHRVLRRGGSFCIMIYHKNSVNYYLEIMFLRKALRALLLPSWGPAFTAFVTGFDKKKLGKIRDVLIDKKRKITGAEWLSMNTDGPDCPLSRVYTREDAVKMFSAFRDVTTEVCFFDKRHWSFFGKLVFRDFEKFIGRRWGWHLVVRGRK